MRVAYLSMHTSPLSQPGIGDAGGMNVYVDQLARAMAQRGISVDVFTRADAPGLGERVTIVPGYVVHHIDAGPWRSLPADRLAAQVRRFAAGVLGALRYLPPIDVIHTHYWLSAWAGLLVKAELGVPMAHSFHTLGRVKDLTRRHDEPPEPLLRIAAETEVIAASDCVIAATPAEAEELMSHYGARPEALCVSPPGVDHRRFYPGSASAARRLLDLRDGPLVAFVGRIQAHKGVDVAARAFELVKAECSDASLVVVGGPSGPRGQREMRELRMWAEGLAPSVTLMGPLPHPTLALVYRAADVVHVPSRSESFGLVAVEAQASGTPVVAAAVGGLVHVIDDAASGTLVPGWDPADHAAALVDILTDTERRRLMSKHAVEWAERFSWDNAAARFEELYAGIIAAQR